MPFVLQLPKLDLELPLQQIHGLLGVVAQHLLHPHEFGLVAHNHAGIGGDAGFAIGKGIQGIDGDVGGDAGRELDLDFYIAGGVVDDFLDLDFVGIVGFYDAFDQTGGGGPKGDVFDQQGLFVGLLNASPTADLAATQAVVVVAHVDVAAGEEVGVQLK